MINKNFALWLRRNRGSKQRRRRRQASYKVELLQLEDRRLLAPVPIPQANPRVDLSSIFWNGGAPLNPNGFDGVTSPDANGAGKTITISNYGPHTIYPFLRSENGGKDPNSTKVTKDGEKWYDPQDLHLSEFREYVGYSQGGEQFLGLPSGATITFEVPLVLWDGDNISLVTDGAKLTTPKTSPGGTLFGYEPSAKVTIATTGQNLSGSVWVKGGTNYHDQKPLVMFYHADTSSTVSDDAPSQPAEATFRDPYLTNFITDPFQTFALINYDVTNVNKLAAPGAVEAKDAPIFAGAVASNNLQIFGTEDFGWNGSNKDLAAFDGPLEGFVGNVGKASLGTYFGTKGWPTFYNPNKGEINIPSGQDLFDLSPLDTHGNTVHTSNYDSNHWILTTSGRGAIRADAGGDILTDPMATRLPLIFTSQSQREQFIANIKSMQENKETVDLTISTADPKYQGVLGSLVNYDPSSSVRAYIVSAQGSDYSDETILRITGGGGSGAEGDLHIENGKIVSIGLNPAHAGTGYTSPPKIEIIDPTGKGHGAKATADITGGTAIVNLAPGKTLPVGTGLSYVFKRAATDYATTAITNLWYSWANYYVSQITQAPSEAISGKFVLLDVDDPTKPGTTVSNQIQLQAAPSVPLAVGMTVTAPDGIPAGTTILKIVGNTIYLSQVPNPQNPNDAENFTFGLPQKLAIDSTSEKYTTPYTLSFDAAATPNAVAFAASVYETMSAEALRLQLTPGERSPYLPTTMDVVSNVIKFNANLPTHDTPWGKILVGEVRDLVKSILRGVYDFTQVPDQSKWYPEPDQAPKGLTSGQTFNPFNLDPYVWFIHKIEDLTGYAFSVDDDVANPAASGGGINSTGHAPSNIHFGFAGIKGTGVQAAATPLGNQKEWFPLTPWGRIKTKATIGVWDAPNGIDPAHKGYSYIKLPATEDPKTVLGILNRIRTPGPGEIGAFISAPGFIVPGTMLTFFPAGVLDAKAAYIILSQPAKSTNGKLIDVTIDADQSHVKRTKVAVKNPTFAAPIQTAPNFYTQDPTGSGWNFAGTAGIAANQSIYAKNNPAPTGTQVGYIQNTGSISQTVNLEAGQLYAVRFLVAERLLDGGGINSQTLRVTLDNKTVIGTFTPVAANGSRYVEFFTNPFEVPDSGTFPAGGPHTITITGTNLNGGDNTVLIDDVTITGGSLRAE
jgi:hypothetical protein